MLSTSSFYTSRLFLSVFYFLIYLSLKAQDLHFDSLGLLVTPPPHIIKSNNSVNVSVDILHSDTWPGVMKQSNRFGFLNAVCMGEQTDEEVDVSLRIFSIQKFFKDNITAINNIPSSHYADFISTNCLTIPKFDDFKVNQTNSFQAKYATILEEKITLPDCSKACQIAYIQDRIDSLKLYLKQLYEFQQKAELIRELVQSYKPGKNSSIFNEPVPDEKKESLPFIFSRPDKNTVQPDKITYGFRYKINSKELTHIDKSNQSYTTEVQLDPNKLFQNISLSRENLFDNTVLDWHNKTYELLNPADIDHLAGQLDGDSILMIPLLPDFENCKVTCSDARKQNLIALKDLLERYDKVWCYADPIGKYLINWLWYSGGDFKLNYFKFTNPDNIATEVDRAKLTELVRQQNEVKQKIGDLSKCLSCDTASVRTLERLHSKLDSVNHLIDGLEAVTKNYSKNLILYNNFANRSSEIHKVTFPSSKRDGINYSIYFNVNDDFVNHRQNKVVLPESYSVYFGFYNSKIKDTSSDLTLKEDIKVYNDSGRLVRDVTSAAQGLSTVASLFTSYGPLVSGFLQNLTGNANRGFNPPGKSEAAGATECDKLVDHIRSELWRFRLLHRMTLEYRKNPTPGFIAPTKSDSVLYSTFSIKSKPADAPYTDQYLISYKNKQVVSDQFNIGRERIVTFGVGIFYSQTSNNQVNVDTSGNKFVISNTSSEAQFVVGVKVFPWKSFAPDGNIIPRFPLRRISIFAGFEITHPLDNLYLGLGYDIVPGIQFTAGVNAYKKNLYQVRNNTIISQTTTYSISNSLYYGVTLDPILVAALLKSFFTVK